MADKAVGDLPQASVINANDLFLLEQGGEAKNIPGSLLTAFIDRNIVAVTVNIVPSTQAGGGSYNTQTGALILEIPEGNGIAGLTKIGSSGAVDTYKLLYEDDTYNTFNVTNGSSIQSISKTGSATVSGHVVDTYTVTLTNGNTSTFTVTNGADGQGQVNTVAGISPDANLDIPEASLLNKVRLKFEGKTVATSAWASDATYSDFPYKADVSCTGVTASDFAEVVFSEADAMSGDFAPICATGSGFVRIYATAVPASTVTIPSIVVWR